MDKKFGLVALAVLAFGFASRSNAGTEMLIDDSAQQESAYTYAPPRVVCYAPPPVRVVVVPVQCYAAPGLLYAHQRVCARPRYCPPQWR